jgi:branched-chain amino acid transport system substrate-binding protein
MTVTALSVVCVLAAGCSAGSGGGSTASGGTLNVDIVAAFTGPYHDIIESLYKGIQVYQAQTNAAGGINGRKLNFRQVDTLSTAQGATAACAKVQGDGSLTAITIADPSNEVEPCLEKAGYPSFYYGQDENLIKGWKNSFDLTATDQQYGRDLVNFAIDRFGARNKTVGAIYIDTPQEQAEVKGFIQEAKQQGLHIKSIQTGQSGQASFVPELTRLQNAGVNVIAFFGVAESIGTLRDAQNMRYKPTFVFSVDTGLDLVSEGGKSLFNGAYAIRYGAPNEGSTYDAYLTAAGKNGLKGVPSESFLYYGFAKAVGDILAKSGTNPTQASLRKAVTALSNYNNHILPPLSFSATKTIGADAAFPATCCNSSYGWKTYGPAGSTSFQP